MLTATLRLTLLMQPRSGFDTIQSVGGWRGNTGADLRSRFDHLRSGSVSPRYPSALIANQSRLPTYKERHPVGAASSRDTSSAEVSKSRQGCRSYSERIASPCQTENGNLSNTPT